MLLARLAPARALALLPARDPLYALAGERLAERELRRLGWRFLARRLRTRWAEIDLLFADGATLVVIEVKTGRAGARFRPGQRFGREALERRWRAARALARGGPFRVDLLEVVLEGQRPPRLVHHRDVRIPLGDASLPTLREEASRSPPFLPRPSPRGATDSTADEVHSG